MKWTAAEVIELLNLEPLPEEGGFFRETYRSKKTIPGNSTSDTPEDRACSTQIFYLVTPDEFSGLHRVKTADEFFHFYLGDPVEMVQITDDGILNSTILGSDIGSQFIQVNVPQGVWQGTRLVDGGDWALLGCTVSPGFEYNDFEILTRKNFLELFPQHSQSIIEYTRP